MSTKTISLDFYNHNIEYLNAKQNDTGRNVNIVCTDYGKKVCIDPDKHYVFVKYKKSDGNIVFDGFDEGMINSDGTVTISLTSQMLSETGKQKLEIALVRSEGLNVDNLSSIQSFEDFGVNLISTMPLYINVVSSVFDESEVTSTSEFSALTNAMARMTAIDTSMRNLQKEVDDLMGEPTDDASKDTLYGVKAAATAVSNNAQAVIDILGKQSDSSSKNTLYGTLKGMKEATTSANEAASSANEAATAATAAAAIADTKMDKANPTGTGSFSLNRKKNTTIGNNSFSEGTQTTASGNYSHAEGSVSTASGTASHAEGIQTTASGGYSHAEGSNTTASGTASHAEGTHTIASASNQHVQGQYNFDDPTCAHIMGNGTSSSNRSNAHTVDWDGNAWFAGDVYVGGDARLSGTKLAKDGHKHRLLYLSAGDYAPRVEGQVVLGYDDTVRQYYLRPSNYEALGSNITVPVVLGSKVNGYNGLFITQNTSISSTVSTEDADYVKLLYLSDAGDIHLGSINNQSYAMGYENSNTYVNASHNLVLRCADKGMVAFESISDSTDYGAAFRFKTNENYDDGTALGTPSYRWYKLYASTACSTTSDEREKSDIIALSDYPITYSNNSDENIFENFFYKLNPKTYTLNIEKSNNLHIGFIAQDIEKTLSDLGLSSTDMAFINHSYWTDEETKDEIDRYSLAYEEFIALNTYMIQKQKSKIDEQQVKINSLEERIKILEEKLQK